MLSLMTALNKRRAASTSVRVRDGDDGDGSGAIVVGVTADATARPIATAWLTFIIRMRAAQEPGESASSFERFGHSIGTFTGTSRGPIPRSLDTAPPTLSRAVGRRLPGSHAKRGGRRGPRRAPGAAAEANIFLLAVVSGTRYGVLYGTSPRLQLSKVDVQGSKKPIVE